jgi:hypothetical protein
MEENMPQILIKEKKYRGTYVAVKDISHTKVISSGKDPKKVQDEAVKKGFDNPLLIYVPKKNMVHIF